MEDHSVLIEPRKIPGDPHIDHPIILNLFEPYLEFLRKELKIKKTGLKRIRFPSMSFFTKTVDGKKISVCGTPLGAPQAAIILERLIAMGARKILAFGCCGSLQADLQIGHLVVPTDALSEEGTSVHYPLPEGVRAKGDEKISELCLEKGKEKNMKTVAGKVWTTDALFRETRGKVERYGEMGLLAVEMEMSALFTIARYRKVRLGGLMVVSDELSSLKWKTGFLNPLFWFASKKATKVAVESCLALF
ncbi:MAG: nucleoside phosphorylase [Thermodesulfobacteriota bacterium]|nr:nucleoside phosphorylase [Thermodesulfobacteriota bacterium]